MICWIAWGFKLSVRVGSLPCIAGFILSNQDFRQSPNCHAILSLFMLH